MVAWIKLGSPENQNQSEFEAWKGGMGGIGVGPHRSPKACDPAVPVYEGRRRWMPQL
jgi:hypothetical protein